MNRGKHKEITIDCWRGKVGTFTRTRIPLSPNKEMIWTPRTLSISWFFVLLSLLLSGGRPSPCEQGECPFRPQTFDPCEEGVRLSGPSSVRVVLPDPYTRPFSSIKYFILSGPERDGGVLREERQGHLVVRCGTDIRGLFSCLVSPPRVFTPLVTHTDWPILRANGEVREKEVTTVIIKGDYAKLG